MANIPPFKLASLVATSKTGYIATGVDGREYRIRTFANGAIHVFKNYKRLPYAPVVADAVRAKLRDMQKTAFSAQKEEMEKAARLKSEQDAINLQKLIQDGISQKWLTVEGILRILRNRGFDQIRETDERTRVELRNYIDIQYKASKAGKEERFVDTLRKSVSAFRASQFDIAREALDSARAMIPAVKAETVDSNWAVELSC